MSSVVSSQAHFPHLQFEHSAIPQTCRLSSFICPIGRLGNIFASHSGHFIIFSRGLFHTDYNTNSVKNEITNCSCDYCGKSFYRKPCNIKNAKHHFCNHECRSLFILKGTPRLIKSTCSTCGTDIQKRSCATKFKTTEHFFCSRDCKNKFSFENGQRGISKIADRPLSFYALRKDANRFAAITSNARMITRDRRKICTNCGYSKHVETCHIKAISSFPLDTLVGTINAPENLVLLCPNCHWEFDHGILLLMHAQGIEPCS
jgi:5-methylcytosine-specific restriction endonuclease McrA